MRTFCASRRHQQTHAPHSFPFPAVLRQGSLHLANYLIHARTEFRFQKNFFSPSWFSSQRKGLGSILCKTTDLFFTNMEYRCLEDIKRKEEEALRDKQVRLNAIKSFNRHKDASSLSKKQSSTKVSIKPNQNQNEK